jgi:hydroxymethylbilane synthase
VDLRGNIETRLKKLEQNQFNGIIMAEVAISRLVLNHVKYYRFSLDEMLPAVGQGAIGVQCRRKDTHLKSILKSINDSSTYACVTAERAFLKRLDSGCQFPVAANARFQDEVVHLTGLVASMDGRHILKDTIVGDSQKSEELGEQLAEKLIHQGALDLLSKE